MTKHRKGLLALSPLAVFVGFYLVASLFAHDFYQVPITVAFMFASIYAVAIFRSHPLTERIATYSQGAGSENMMLMLWIFVMAGAFAGTAKDMGSIDATVRLTLSLLPADWLLPGLFLASCLISLSIGTSVGTVVALVPIAAAIPSSTGISGALITAAVVGGSFFGDNLSFISDTTVAATASQQCRMSDKFRANAFIVMPVALIVFIAYWLIGREASSVAPSGAVDYWAVLPYVAVLIAAIVGFNVLAVLAVGLLLTGLVGIADGAYDVYGWLGSMGKGILGMSELIIITMMAGGLLEMIKTNGGIDYLLGALTRNIRGKRGAEYSIALLVAVVNLCTANNTVAIITTGGIARELGERFGVDSRKRASILDTVSCSVQGILPYGAQVLMAAGLSHLNPMAIVPHLYYPMAIALATVLAIAFRYPRKYS